MVRPEVAMKPKNPGRKRGASADTPASEPDGRLRSGKVLGNMPSEKPGHAGHHWTFLTNHSHVLVLLSRDPSMVLREVALRVGITERAVQRIIADLESGGVIEREKVGRQNHYRIRREQPLRHPVEADKKIGEMLDLLNSRAT